jgi:hypothetical protein
MSFDAIDATHVPLFSAIGAENKGKLGGTKWQIRHKATAVLRVQAVQTSHGLINQHPSVAAPKARAINRRPATRPTNPGKATKWVNLAAAISSR